MFRIKTERTYINVFWLYIPNAPRILTILRPHIPYLLKRLPKIDILNRLLRWGKPRALAIHFKSISQSRVIFIVEMVKGEYIMKFLHKKTFIIMFFSFFLSGCSLVEATYDIVTLPIVIVGEAAEGAANIISGDDDDDDDDDKKEKKKKDDVDDDDE